MSGLIGLAIIGIWLVVLVPMWLNRHEADDATRSMDSFSTAMRVLSRRPPSRGDRRYVVMPRRDDLGVTVDNNPGATTTGRRLLFRRRTPPVVSPAGHARLIARRRRLTAVVLGLLLVLLIASAMGLTSWWYELAVGLAAAGYVIHLRNEAIRAQELRRRRRARAARAMTSSEQWDAPQPTYRQPVAAAPRPVLGDDEVLPAAPVSATGTENGSRWAPVPVPLPTYVSKPVVQRPAASAAPRADVDATRTIDLTRPGAWTEAAAAGGDVEIDHRHLLLDETGSGRIASSAGAPASPYPAAYRAAAADDDDELDHILNRRRAVGD